MAQIANGYDRTLADRGEGLSGGQRQSIAIARALVGSPRVLLLDEPSSAMDQQSETTFIERLDQTLEGATLLVITHRTSMLRLVSRLIIMDAGKVVADGPRDAVLQAINRPAAPAA
jgi:ATP-binding cassette subfamily C protein LapB